MKLLISTGPGLTASREGHIVVFDYERKCVVDSLSYQHRVHESNRKGLEGASWYKDNLLVASECELLTLDVAPLKLVESRSFPFFNDVHHVVASGDQIWICNSGLDRIDEFDASWQPVRSHNVMGPPTRRLRYAVTSFRRNTQKWYSRLSGWEIAYDHHHQGDHTARDHTHTWSGLGNHPAQEQMSRELTWRTSKLRSSGLPTSSLQDQTR